MKIAVFYCYFWITIIIPFQLGVEATFENRVKFYCVILVFYAFNGVRCLLLDFENVIKYRKCNSVGFLKQHLREKLLNQGWVIQSFLNSEVKFVLCKIGKFFSKSLNSFTKTNSPVTNLYGTCIFWASIHSKLFKNQIFFHQPSQFSKWNSWKQKSYYSLM